MPSVEEDRTVRSMEKSRALVTGADGFIGSHLVEMLVEQGRPVRALCFYNSFNSWGWLDDSPVRDQIEIVTGDIRDAHFCDTITRDVHTVYHLAALIGIPYSYRAPDSYVDTNIRGTVNVCQAARSNGVQRIMQTSTSEVYGTAQYVPIDEQHPLQSQSPYSASKIGADHLAMSFHAAFDLPVTIVRPFNTYGPRQSARAVIPTIITQLVGGASRIDLGDLTPTRDFNYVSDTCRAFIELAATAEAVGETVNVGSNKEVSIGDLFALIKEIMSAEVEVAVDEARMRPASSEVYRLWCDNSKIKRLTGFEPTVGLREGLTKTVAWFRESEHLRNYKAHLYNV